MRGDVGGLAASRTQSGRSRRRGGPGLFRVLGGSGCGSGPMPRPGSALHPRQRGAILVRLSDAVPRGLGMNPKSMSGWIVFAGILMLIAGVMAMFEGLIALMEDEYFVPSQSGFLVLDLTGRAGQRRSGAPSSSSRPSDCSLRRRGRAGSPSWSSDEFPRRPTGVPRQHPVPDLVADDGRTEHHRAVRADRALGREQGRPDARGRRRGAATLAQERCSSSASSSPVGIGSSSPRPRPRGAPARSRTRPSPRPTPAPARSDAGTPREADSSSSGCRWTPRVPRVAHQGEGRGRVRVRGDVVRHRGPEAGRREVAPGEGACSTPAMPVGPS